MRLVPLLLSVLFLCVSTSAQEPDVSMAVTTVDEHPMFSINNTHNSPVEAFLVTVDTSATNKPLTRVYYDVHSNYRRDKAIPPGTSQQVPLPHIVGQDLPVPTLRAVVFSDGTSLGDASWVQELLHRRDILSDRIKEVMVLLQNISDKNLTRQEALDVLQQARQARKGATPDATMEERVWHDQVFYMAIRNLQGNARGSGHAFEVPSVVKSVNHFLKDWLADLQTSKPTLQKSAEPNG